MAGIGGIGGLARRTRTRLSFVPYLRRRLGRATTFADISDPAGAEERLPPLDRPVAPGGLSERQRRWRADGVLVLPGFLPDGEIDRYVAVRERLSLLSGWAHPYPYLSCSELRDLALFAPLRAALDEVVGDEMCLSLALTGWVSTERNWHQDDYLNPPDVDGWYVAAWLALDDIPSGSGPFQYVPGSHRWPAVRGDKVRRLLAPGLRVGARWPAESEALLNGIFEEQIEQTAAPVETFLAKRGDVLIWHARLAHRGSIPTVHGAERRSLICHYTARRRAGGRGIEAHAGGGHYLAAPAGIRRELREFPVEEEDRPE